jgi:hypothetical protein
MPVESLNINFSDYTKKGIYLILKDGNRLDLTEDRIKEVTAKYWEDPSKLPPEMKSCTGLQRCSFCPLVSAGSLCDAIRPFLPFLEILDKFVSFDPVIAIYKGHRKEFLRLANTTMQDALVYLSILSLMDYCQAARQYRRYFYGVTPLMSAKEASARIYLNFFWEKKGDKAAINQALGEFKSLLKETAKNEMKRLSLISQNDVFTNAIVKAQIITEFLILDYDQILAEAFREIEREYS